MNKFLNKRFVTLLAGTVGNLVALVGNMGYLTDTNVSLSQQIIGIVAAAVIQIGVIAYGESE